MRLLSVVGNRPQFIKSAPLSVALREAEIDEIVVHTGQHYDPELSQVFFDELGLSEPDHRLGLQTADPETMRPRIHEVVGDVMADASLRFAPIARERSDALRRFGVAPREFVLVTLHRVANVQQDRLRRIVEGLNSVDDPIVFPAHPRTREALAGLEPR